MDETRIELLTAKHERATFDCGKSPLNAFLRQHAPVNHERGVSRVYVAVRGTQQQVHASYASSAGAFLREQLPPDDQAGLPRYPLPTAHQKLLGRFAAAPRVQSIPDELQIIQQGKDPGHYGITPKQPMTPERFQELLNQVEFE